MIGDGVRELCLCGTSMCSVILTSKFVPSEEGKNLQRSISLVARTCNFISISVSLILYIMGQQPFCKSGHY